MKQFSRNYILIFMALLIGAYSIWGVYRKFTIIENPRPQFITYNLHTASLLQRAEANINAAPPSTANSQAQQANAINMLHQSNAHFDMARIYAQYGNFEAADSHFKKIILNADQTGLLQIFLQKMFYAAEQNDYQKVFGIVLDSDNISDQITAIGNVPNDGEDPLPFASFSAPSQAIKATLCTFAARIMAQRQRTEELTQLVALPHCAQSIERIKEYQFAATMKGDGSRLQKFNTLIDLVHDEKDSNQSLLRLIPLVQYCLGPENATLPAYASTATQVKTAIDSSGDDAIRALGALFLLQPHVENSAGQTAEKIKDNALRKHVYQALYNNYLKEKDRENIFGMTKIIRADTAIKAHISENILYGNILNNPSTLAYEIALQQENPQGRARLLWGIYLNAKKQHQSNIAFPDCTDDYGTCLITAMTQTIKKIDEEKTDSDKNQAAQKHAPLLNLARMQSDFGDYEAVQSTLESINHIRLFSKAHNGICTPEMAAPPHAETKLESLDLLSECNIQSGVYKNFVLSPGFKALQTHSIETNILSDAYLAALVKNLSKGGNADDALSLIKQIEAPPLRQSSARSLWKAMLPPHPSMEQDWKNHALYQSQADRTTFLNNLLNDPFFKDDIDFWNNIMTENNNHFWKYYPQRASITATEDNIWSKEIWAVHNKISVAKPHLAAPKCGNMSFDEVDLGGCRIQWLIVQGYYQYAMNDSRNDDKAADRAYTARQIMIERLMKTDQNFRDTLSINGSFPYLANQANKCPI